METNLLDQFNGTVIISFDVVFVYPHVLSFSMMLDKLLVVCSLLEVVRELFCRGSCFMRLSRCRRSVSEA